MCVCGFHYSASLLSEWLPVARMSDLEQKMYLIEGEEIIILPLHTHTHTYAKEGFRFQSPSPYAARDRLLWLDAEISMK